MTALAWIVGIELAVLLALAILLAAALLAAVVRGNL